MLTTTTTRILVPTPEQSEIVLIDPDPSIIAGQVASARHWRHVTAVAAPMDEAGKLGGFPPEAIGGFQASGLFDWIIVEADGSARRPLKAPADHEPVIPATSTIVVAVAGLEVLGRPLREDLVFRHELAGELMNLAAGETITESALALLLAHPLGSFKGAPPAARRFIFLNKADDDFRRRGGARVAELLRQETNSVAEAVFVGQAIESILVHAVSLEVLAMSNPPKVAGIVLAAGEGSRMGSTKQLLPFRGSTLLECVVDSALASSLHRVVVVIGHKADELLPLLEKRPVTVVLNPRYASGQSSSLKSGLQALVEKPRQFSFFSGTSPSSVLTSSIVFWQLTQHPPAPLSCLISKESAAIPFCSAGRPSPYRSTQRRLWRQASL